MLSTMMSRYFSQLIDLVVAEQDLAEAGAVGLHRGLPLYCSTVAVPPKIRLRVQLLEHRRADVAAAGIDARWPRAGMPAWMNAAAMRYGVHGSCGPGLSTRPICSGMTGSHSVCTPGEFDGSTRPRPATGPGS